MDLRKRMVAVTAAFVLGPLSAAVLGSVLVEQVEGYDNLVPTEYAPLDFAGSATRMLTVTDYGGVFSGITFHAIDTSKINSTQSSHAFTVGELIFGNGSPAYPFVSNVYNAGYDDFLATVNTQDSVGVAAAPGHFSTSVQVVNTSYVVDYGSKSPNTATTDTDALRRMDFMINRDDVTFVASAVTNVGNGNVYTLNWSSFNSLAVSGAQTFDPNAGSGKKHADLSGFGEASFETAAVSGDAAALYGLAQTAGQTDAQHGYVMRSILMAGADKDYAHPISGAPTGALDPVRGAGLADYDKSVSILQGGEKSLLGVGTGSTILGTPNTTQKGWASANVSAGAQSAVLFDSSNAITSLTASLNWNVTSSTASSNRINTSNGALIFPNLTLEVRPVTFVSGSYVLGASLGNYMLQSAVAGDNAQYLWSTTTLPSGTYAFLIGGGSTTTAVGFSYALNGSFASNWNSNTGGSWAAPANWTNGIPNGQAAQANLLASPGLTSPGTISLDGNRTVGQLTINNANQYLIAATTGGTLTIDDTGDSTGTVAPLINVLAGPQQISAPVALANGVAITTASSASLTITGGISGSGGLIKSGTGSLLFSAADNYGNTTINAGKIELTATGSLTGTVTVNNLGLLVLDTSSSGILTRTLPITINAGGLLALSTASVPANRQLLISSGFSLAGSLNAWTSKLNIANNDLDVPGGSLATLTNQAAQGYNSGTWKSAGGIDSLAAEIDARHLTALGVIQNNQNGSAIFTATNPFDGNTPGESDILVKYTYYGDANLDGKVDGSDYSLIDNGFLTQATGWFNGDFNYDGVIDGSDYTLIDNAFNTQGASLAAIIAAPQASSTAQIASVPEPAMVSVLFASLLLSRCRSKSSRSVPTIVYPRPF